MRLGNKILKETLKRIKPWMWKRNIQANINNKKIKYEKVFKKIIWISLMFLLFSNRKGRAIVPYYYFPTIKIYKNKVYILAKMHINFFILVNMKTVLT